MADLPVSRRVFLRVRELLGCGQPLARIALQTGLSLATIEGIAAGRIQPSRLIIEPDDPQREAIAHARRCPGCGGMVYVWPCLACRMNSPQSVHDDAATSDRPASISRAAA